MRIIMLRAKIKTTGEWMRWPEQYPPGESVMKLLDMSTLEIVIK